MVFSGVVSRLKFMYNVLKATFHDFRSLVIGGPSDMNEQHNSDVGGGGGWAYRHSLVPKGNYFKIQ